MKKYKTYIHRGQDPMVAKVLDTLGGKSFAETSRQTGVGAGTLSNWRKKKTMRPQHTTMAAIAALNGYEFILRKKK